MSNIPKPNFYPDASFPEYVSWDAVNQSTLKHFEKSAAHVRAYMTQPPDETQAQGFGTAGHLAVLDPQEFKRQYFAGPEGDKRYKGVKEAWALAEEEHPDAIGLRPAEYRACIGIQESIWNHSYAASLLRSEGYNEASFVWKDMGAGLLCKARTDRITQAPDGWSAVVDLKTIREASDQQIEWAIKDYKYHIQGAFYLQGLNELMPAERKWLLIFIEKSPPYGVRVIEVELAAMELGRRRIRKYLQMYRECTDTGIWPGYGSGVEVVGVPEYEYRKEEREMEDE